MTRRWSVPALAGLLGLMMIVTPFAPQQVRDSGPLLGVLTPEIAAAATATGSASNGEPDGSANAAVALAVPATTPGTHYKTFAGVEFQPRTSSLTYSNAGGGALAVVATASASSLFTLPMDLPHGATVTQVIWYVTDNNPGASASMYTSRFVPANDTLADVTTSFTSTPGASPAIQAIVAAPASPLVVDNAAATYLLQVSLGSTSNMTLWGARVGYTPATREFHPIPPTRVYDSRFDASGQLGPAEGTRVTNVYNGIDLGTGAVNAPNVVPAGATAIAYNLTIAETQGAGFLAVYPASEATFTASSINWDRTGQLLANAAIVQISTARQVKVSVGGGGSTHYVIDVTGYYL
jgi:hypothetical protein